MHELLEESQTIHAWHVEIKHDDVGPSILHLFKRDDGVGRRHYAYVGGWDECLSNHLAGYRRIIYEQDADGHVSICRRHGRATVHVVFCIMPHPRRAVWLYVGYSRNCLS